MREDPPKKNANDKGLFVKSRIASKNDFESVLKHRELCDVSIMFAD